MAYLAIVSWNENNKITKFLPYDTQAEADSHVATYGGVVIQEPDSPWVLSYTVIDPAAKTMTYDVVSYERDQTMNNWMRDITATDNNIPRYLEDLITDNPDFNIHEKMKTRYDEKVALRATQPKE
jgi:hypothetical protein